MKNKLPENIQEQLDKLLAFLKKIGRSEYIGEHYEIPKLSSIPDGELPTHFNTQTEVIKDLQKQLKKVKTKRFQLASDNLDDLTDKLLQAEIKLSASALQNQHVMAQNIVKTHMAAASSLALLPVPIFDFAALAGTQVNLLRTLSSHFNVDFNEQKGKALLTSLVSGSLPLVTVVGLSSVAKLIPGIGTVSGCISMTILTGAIVYATGQVFIKHFEQGGTLEDFEAKDWKKFFLQTLEQQKAVRQQQAKSDRSDRSTPAESPV